MSKFWGELKKKMCNCRSKWTGGRSWQIWAGCRPCTTGHPFCFLKEFGSRRIWCSPSSTMHTYPSSPVFSLSRPNSPKSFLTWPGHPQEKRLLHTFAPNARPIKLIIIWKILRTLYINVNLVIISNNVVDDCRSDLLLRVFKLFTLQHVISFVFF